MLFNKSKKKCLKKSEYSTVIKNLDAICTCLDKIYHINNGGCCYISYIIADILHKEGIDYEVIVVPGEETDLPDNFDDITYSAYHVFIKVDINDKDYLINSYECSTEDIAISYVDITPEQILAYYKRTTWNNLYNVAKNKFVKYVINLIYDNFSSSL